jgi:hypothetical protein
MQDSCKMIERIRPRFWLLSAAALGCCLATIGVSTAADPKPAAPAGKPAPQKIAPPSSLDDALLEDLDNELLDGVKDLPTKKPPAKKSTAKNDSNRGGDKSADDDISLQPADAAQAEGEMTEQNAASSDEEPLARIGQQMRTVEKQLEGQQAAGNTQQLQGQILSDLAVLIKKLEQQCQSQNSSDSKPSKSQSQQAQRDSVKQLKPGSGNPSSQPSNKPAKESSDRLSKNDTQKPDLDAIKGMLKDAWGQLPPHAREQMLQSPPEQFLPKYELLIEKYYKRLAEEQKQKP